MASFASRVWLPPDVKTLVGNLLMLQDNESLKRGALFNTYFHNGPLWSLAYEWWFYLLFFVIARKLLHRPRAQQFFAFTMSFVATILDQFRPNGLLLYASYFFIWWCGVELGREYLAAGRITVRRQIFGIIGLLLLGTVWAASAVHARQLGETMRLGTEPLLQLRHVMFAAVVLLIACLWQKVRLVGFDYVVGPFAVVAPISYALYVFHVPILEGARTMLPDRPLADALVTLTIVVPVAWLCEVVLQKHANAAFARLERRASPRPADAEAAAALTPP